MLLELADKVPPISAAPLEEFLRGRPRVAQDTLRLTAPAMPSRAQELKGQAHCAGPPVRPSRKASGMRTWPSVQTSHTMEPPNTTCCCFLDHTHAASPRKRAEGFSMTVSSKIRYPPATVHNARKARVRRMCPDRGPLPQAVHTSVGHAVKRVSYRRTGRDVGKIPPSAEGYPQWLRHVSSQKSVAEKPML